ncbi:BQ2448_881 [Microbotryum intermedium]|uniref:BQ2448_881 protein n=1 Tax=Microbotryum intermedium TaxID=269621 RepID=A0A238F3T1_9BASI|nr:BQ2448_881 [Microbotryum intermedium]
MASAMLTHRPPKAPRPSISSGGASLLARFPPSSSNLAPTSNSTSTSTSAERPPQASTSTSTSTSTSALIVPVQSHDPPHPHHPTSLMDESILDFDQLLHPNLPSHQGKGATTMTTTFHFDDDSFMLNDQHMSFLQQDDSFGVMRREPEDGVKRSDDPGDALEVDSEEQQHGEKGTVTSQEAANQVAPVEAQPPTVAAIEEPIIQQSHPLQVLVQKSPVELHPVQHRSITTHRRSSISPILKRNKVVAIPTLDEVPVPEQPVRPSIISTNANSSASSTSTSALPSTHTDPTLVANRPVRPAHILPKHHPSHPRILDAVIISVPRPRDRSRSRSSSTEPIHQEGSHSKPFETKAERRLSPSISTRRPSAHGAAVSPISTLTMAPPPPPPRTHPIGDYLAPLAEVSDEEVESRRSKDQSSSFETTLPTPYKPPPPQQVTKDFQRQKDDSMMQEREEDVFEIEMEMEEGNDLELDRHEALDADGSLPRIGESLNEFEHHRWGGREGTKNGRRMTTSTPAKVGVMSGMGRRVSVVAGRLGGLRGVGQGVLDEEEEGGMMRQMSKERNQVDIPVESQNLVVVKEVKASSMERALAPPPKAPLPPPVAIPTSTSKDPSLPKKRRASRAFEGRHQPVTVVSDRPEGRKAMPTKTKATISSTRRASTVISHPNKAFTSKKAPTRTPAPSAPTLKPTEITRPSIATPFIAPPQLPAAPPKTTLRLNYTYTRAPPTTNSTLSSSTRLTTIRLFDPCTPINEEEEGPGQGQRRTGQKEVERARLPAKIGDLTVPMEYTFGARAEERERLRKERKERITLEVKGGIRQGVKRTSTVLVGDRGSKRPKFGTAASSQALGAQGGAVLGPGSKQNLPSFSATTAPIKPTTSTQPKPFNFLNRHRPAPPSSTSARPTIQNSNSLQAQREVATALEKASNLDRLGWSERQKLREEEVRRRKEVARKEEEEAERLKLKSLKERLLRAKAPEGRMSTGSSSGMRR